MPDVQGQVILGEIIPGHPMSLETRVNVLEIKERLQADHYEVLVSDDAGGYVCNYLYYKSAVSLADVADVLVIHIPVFDVLPESISLIICNEIIRILRQSYIYVQKKLYANFNEAVAVSLGNTTCRRLIGPVVKRPWFRVSRVVMSTLKEKRRPHKNQS